MCNAFSSGHVRYLRGNHVNDRVNLCDALAREIFFTLLKIEIGQLPILKNKHSTCDSLNLGEVSVTSILHDPAV